MPRCHLLVQQPISVCHHMLVTILSAEEASGRTLWLQGQRCSSEYCRQSCVWKVLSYGRLQVWLDLGAYAHCWDLVSSIPTLCSYLGFSVGSTNMTSGTSGFPPVRHLCQRNLRADFHWPMWEPIMSEPISCFSCAWVASVRLPSGLRMEKRSSPEDTGNSLAKRRGSV